MNIEVLEKSNSTVSEAGSCERCLSSVAEGEAARLSFAQEQLWFLQHLEPDLTAYNLPRVFRLTGPLDIRALVAAFSAVIDRHAVLRTRFFKQKGVPMQVVEPTRPFELETIDLSVCKPSERETQLNTAVEEVVSHVFDLGRAPAMVARLIKLDEHEQILAVCLHHIVSDAWSNPILARDLSDAYRLALHQGETPYLTPLPLQYIDYAVWQRERVRSGALERDLAYWNSYLGDEVPPLELPLDFQRPASQSFEGAAIEFDVDASLGAALQAFCRTERYTPFVVLLTAWQVLLARYSGQDEFAIGVPSSGRSCEEVQELMGFFVTTQVYRARVVPVMSLRQLCRQVRADAIAALNHADVPFDLLLSSRKDRRETGRSPLFQVMFGVQMTDEVGALDFEGLSVASMEHTYQGAKYELSLDIAIGNEQSHGRLEYNTQLFKENTARRLVDHYLRVLEGMVADADQTVQTLDFMNGTERQQLRQWGVNSTRYPDTEPVHRLIEQQVQAHPDGTALIFNDEQLTYVELNQRANRLAHYLIDLGVKPEVKVGIAVERSIEMVVGLLAILKAGGAYVPLDPEYPQERLAYMVEDSGIDLLLTQNQFKEVLPLGDGLRVLELDSLDLSGEFPDNPNVEVRGDNLAYMIYTSGSTGRPKGAQLCHRNVSRLLQATDDWFHFSPDDVWTLFHSYAFDFSVWELFGALSTGGKLVIVPFWVSRSPEDFLQLLRDQRVTVLNQTPSAFGQLVQLPGTYQETLALRLVIFGGEALDPERLRPWIEYWGDSQPELVNMYGITETTVHVTYRRITVDDLGQPRSPVGVAIPDLGLRVLDGALKLAPVGVPGELYVAGDGLARGYLNRAALTAERFIADPEGDNGERLYRTGDLVRWNGGGELEYLGRIDQQVKIRGFRIELGEIEARLLTQSAVKDAVVVAQESAGGVRLIGYVSLRAEQAVDSSVLRDRLGDILPDYMVPSTIVELDKLPLNANGKVDRKALPEPELKGGQNYEPPQGEVEEVLAQIWSEVLGIERVGRHDNFFELGGHSLLALRVLEGLRRHGWETPVRTVFQNPQLKSFAAAVGKGDTHCEVIVPPNLIPVDCQGITPEMVTLIDLTPGEINIIEAAVPDGAANIQDIYPLAPLQEGLLFHHLLQTEGDAFVTSHVLRFDSRERLDRFIDGFNRVISRHDILRTAVLWENLREPVQVVYRKASLNVRWPDGDSVEPKEGTDTHRLDIRRAPMFKAFAIREAGQSCWLLKLFGHHMVDDNTTLQRLVEEMALIQQGREAELPEPLPFRHFVAQARLGVSEAEHRTFFRRMLNEVEEPTAPFGLLDIQGDGAEVDEAKLTLTEKLAGQVRHQAQRYGVSTAALFHLAWALVVSRTSGRDDVVFGTVLFGRMQGGEGVERALGLFINTLPIRIRLENNDVEHCLRRTHEVLTDLLYHEHASLSLAQSGSGLAGGVPLFTALLNYRHTRQLDLDDTSTAWQGVESLESTERTNYPFGMSVNDYVNGFELVAHISKKIDAQRICQMMLGGIVRIVEALGAPSKNRPVCELPLLGEGEQTRLCTWGINHKRYPSSKPVHRLIEQQVQLHPEAIALLFGDKQLGYGELNARSNRLAHYLIDLGVKPEVKVGIAVDRSIEMVVGLLAILKAGGAYVPLDPEYPVERLAYIVEDSGIELLLTQHHLVEQLPTENLKVIISLDQIDLGNQPDHNPAIAINGENLAYVIYTSGSTGKPKGAAIRHQSLTSCMAWMQQTYNLTSADTVLHKAPFGFDVSVWEIFWPLTTGVRLVVANPGDHRDPERITALICQHQITTLNFVPAMLQAFLAHKNIESQTQLRYVICGGDAMPATTQREALQRLSGVSLQNLYGPTETTIHVTQWACRDDGQTQVPIGRPISATQTYVLDRALTLVPQGVAGELYIGGELLGRGYLQRPDLSAERFVADPFDEQGGRLYRTGDLVRWNANGQLEYLGRIDHQVKIRGFRIELGEVEAQLLAQPGIKEAVVVEKQGLAGSQLVGYVSVMTEHTIDITALRQRLGQVLPDYMVPSAIVVVENLPFNANGKVDRKLLPEPDFVSQTEYEPPQGEVEEILAKIWSQVLGVERVGRNDNFFELGGHSLLALQLLEHMRRNCWSATVRLLFQNSQLKMFAQVIKRSDEHCETEIPPNEIPAGCESIHPEMVTLIKLTTGEINQIESTIPGGATNIQDIYPLVPLQEGILYHHLLQPEGDVYIAQWLLSFESERYIHDFIDALNEIISRYDILRTALLWEGLSEPVQVVCRAAQLSWKWMDTETGLGAKTVAEQLTAYVYYSRFRMDMSQAPLIRGIAAPDVENNRWLMQLLVHHAILDHMSLEQIVKEVIAILSGKNHGSHNPIPYRNFVARNRANSDQGRNIRFFSKLLGDVTTPSIPFGLSNVRGNGDNVGEFRLSLNDELSRRIRFHAKVNEVSPGVIFHLAWAGLVAGATKNPDVVFATVLSARGLNVEGVESPLGLFINTLPMRISFNGKSCQDVLKETGATLADLLDHWDSSLALAQKCSKIGKGKTLFSSLLNYRHSPKKGEEAGGGVESHIKIIHAEERTNYPITVHVDDRGYDFGLIFQVEGVGMAKVICDCFTDVMKSLTELLEDQRDKCLFKYLVDNNHKPLDFFVGEEKVDDFSNDELQSNIYDPPRGIAENLLADIFMEVLGVQGIGRHDNFYELGGDSLLGLRVLEKSRSTNNADLWFELCDFVERPTIAGLMGD